MSYIIIATLSCPRLDLLGRDGGACVSNCGCEGADYHPICLNDGLRTFISPCHAGCKSSNKSTEVDPSRGKAKTLYWDCTCAEEVADAYGRNPIVEPWWSEESNKR